MKKFLLGFTYFILFGSGAFGELISLCDNNRHPFIVPIGLMISGLSYAVAFAWMLVHEK